MTRSVGSILIAVAMSLVPAGAGCSKGQLPAADGGGDAATPSPLACTVAADCTRTEIDHEIRSRADCLCLLGCPFNIVNVTTANRRMAQYQAMCTPGVNAQGQPCPIDDCVQPPPLECVNQLCVSGSITD